MIRLGVRFLLYRDGSYLKTLKMEILWSRITKLKYFRKKKKKESFLYFSSFDLGVYNANAVLGTL